MSKKSKPKVKLTHLQQATLQNHIETLNRKIQRISQTFGKNSATLKKEIAFLQKKPLQRFVSESRSGDIKINYRAVKAFLQEGGMKAEVNEILTKLAGVKIQEDGSILKVGDPLKTVGQIRTEGKKKQEKMGADDMSTDEFIESMNKFAEDFDNSYHAAAEAAGVGLKVLASDPITSKMWGKNRTGRLSYDDMDKIMNRMNELRAQAAAQEEQVENDKIPF